MKIAVAYDPSNGMVNQHFGQSRYFKIYNVQGTEIIGDVVLPTDCEGHDALALLLSSLHMDIVICGGIGGNAKQAISSMGMGLIAGVVGQADAAVNAFLNNTLYSDPSISCSHHGEGNGCGDHDCGSCVHAREHLPQ